MGLLVIAKELWNRLSDPIEKGKTYRVTASGTWMDSYILTDANGYDRWYLAPFKLLRRMPNAKWFELVGAVNRRNPFVIGNERTFIAAESGFLWFYANDIPGFYFNNKGCVQVIVEEI